jgi:hypothetical protein
MNAVRMALLALLLQNAAPQPPGLQTGTASLEGIVVKLGTNDPISGADVELTLQPGGPLAPSGPVQPNQLAQYATPNPPYTATSGPDGKFTFRNIAAGNYKLVAARIGGSLPRGIRAAECSAAAWYSRLEMANRRRTSDSKWRLWERCGTHSGYRQQAVGHAAVMAFSPIYRNGERMRDHARACPFRRSHGEEYRLFFTQAGITSQLGWKT